MRSVVLAALCAIVLIAGPIPSLSAQEEVVTRQWQLSKGGDGQPTLVYGTDSPEDMTIAFDCEPRSGVIRVFVAETNEALKPNRQINATLAAGSTRSRVAGKTVPNEDASVPSFEGTLPATDPLLDALTRARNLSIDVGAWHGQVPLQDIGNKSRELARLCRKP